MVRVIVMIKGRVSQIRQQIEDATSDYDKKNFKSV